MLALGIISRSYSAEFKRYHSLSRSVLKQLGFGRMESRIQAELQDAIARIRAHEGRPFDPAEIINDAVLGVIATVLFGGKQGEQAEAETKQIFHLVHRQGCTVCPNALIMNVTQSILRYVGIYRSAKKCTYDGYQSMVEPPPTTIRWCNGESLDVFHLNHLFSERGY